MYFRFRCGEMVKIKSFNGPKVNTKDQLLGRLETSWSGQGWWWAGVVSKARTQENRINDNGPESSHTQTGKLFECGLVFYDGVDYWVMINWCASLWPGKWKKVQPSFLATHTDSLTVVWTCFYYMNTIVTLYRPKLLLRCSSSFPLPPHHLWTVV